MMVTGLAMADDVVALLDGQSRAFRWQLCSVTKVTDPDNSDFALGGDTLEGFHGTSFSVGWGRLSGGNLFPPLVLDRGVVTKIVGPVLRVGQHLTLGRLTIARFP